MYQRVVVPLDRSSRSEATLAVAAALAERLGAGVEAVTVAPPGRDLSGHEEYLTQAADRLAAPVTTEVVQSEDVAGGILAAASGGQAVICMSSHGRSGVGALVLGSVSEQVVRRSPEAVVLVGPGVPAGPPAKGSVLVGLDGSAMSEQMLPAAARWARALDAPLWLLQVQQPDRGGGRSDVLETSYVHHLADGLRREHDLDLEWDVVHEHHPADALVRVAKELPAAMVALSTHGRSGLRRVALGSVAMKVAHRAPCPLLVLRPDADG